MLAPNAVGQQVKIQQLQEINGASKKTDVNTTKNVSQSTDWLLHFRTNTVENVHISTYQGDITSNSTTESNHKVCTQDNIKYANQSELSKLYHQPDYSSSTRWKYIYR